MRTLRQQLPRLPNYLRKYGRIQGAALFGSIERSVTRGSKDARGHQVPGYAALIHLRETIADHATLWHCGGNIGLSALYLATAYPQAQVFVVKPDDNNFVLLQRNLAHPGQRVTTLKGGIWNRSARLRIVNPEAGSAAFQVNELPVDAGEGLRAYTIDEVCTLAGSSDPLMVKIDIEGAQARLFADNTGWVARTDLIMLELYDWLMPWQGTSRSFFACLGPQPFDYLMSGETIFCFNGGRLAGQ